MWSYHDFLVYRIRLLKPCYSSDTFLTSMLCDGLFLAEQILEWRVYHYVHAAHKQLHKGFNLPSDQFCEF